MVAGRRAREADTPEVDHDSGRAEDGVLVADKSEAKAARRMLQLHKRGMSLRQIAPTLDAEGYKPRGKAWHPQAVKRIIERDQVAS